MKTAVLGAGLSLAVMALAMTGASAATIRIAEHRQARIDALNASIPAIEKKLGVTIEVVEYPAPEKDYMSKLLTELGAGNAPDIFSANGDGDVPDMVAAGYLADVTDAVKAWDGYAQLLDVAKQLSTAADGKMYQLDSMLSVSQLYYRRDILEAAGISTAQPTSWDDLLNRAIEIKKKTGAYGLLLPAGSSWGGGAFYEGFSLFITGSKTPQLANADGTVNLSGAGVKDVLGFYKSLIDNDLMPIDPLLGPEPWAIPKYQMFPAGKLAATTCGTWCYIYDWGSQSKTPVKNVTQVVGTWAVPTEDGKGSTVSVGGQNIWLVNAKSADAEMAKKVMLALSEVQPTVEYAERLGNLPARKDAADNADFQKMPEMLPVLQNAGNGTFLKAAPGFTAVAEGMGRATEALLRKQTDAAGAQKILVDYVKGLLGDDAVK
jgi:multiple sugar transport system substrate-binding protein